MKQDLLEIIDYYGVSKQLKKLNEEVFELEEAVLLELGDEQSLYNITKRIANIYVLLSQFEEYYEIDQEQLIELQSSKIRQNLSRIKNEK